MTPKVITVAPDDPLSVAREHFRTHDIHHLLVVDRNKVVGVISLRELIGKSAGDSVGSAMLRDVKILGPDTSTREAAAAMIGRSHGCLAVVEHGRVVGIVTTTDLLRVLSRSTAAASPRPPQSTPY